MLVRELAGGQTNIVILCDHLISTKTFQDVSLLLEELMAADINYDRNEFRCALASHGSHTVDGFAKKLAARLLKGPLSQRIGSPSQQISELASGHCSHLNCGFGGDGEKFSPSIGSVETIAPQDGSHPKRGYQSLTPIRSGTLRRRCSTDGHHGSLRWPSLTPEAP